MPDKDDEDAHLADDDFRARRQYLPNDAFALSEGLWDPPTDLVPRETWQELISLPTDVLLRTTDRRGRAIAQMNTLWSSWLHNLPLEPNEAPFLFDAALDAADDFNASVFVTVHGYYRQGIANLRSALEGMAIAATFAIRSDTKALATWLAGQSEPKFGNMRDMLAPSLGPQLTDVLKELHKQLSTHVHAGRSGSNAVLWQGSNGPIWEDTAFDQVYRFFRDVMAMCLVLWRLGQPGSSIPPQKLDLFETPGGVWTPAAVAEIKRRFGKTS
jgi:hypothetical protein